MKRTSGAALIEFAISATVLLLLLVGVIDLARLLRAAYAVASAARAGIQYGMYSQANQMDISGMQFAATGSADSAVKGLKATATYFCECPGTAGQVSCTSTCQGGVWIYDQVATSYTFTPLFRWPILPSTYVLNHKATMRVQ